MLSSNMLKSKFFSQIRFLFCSFFYTFLCKSISKRNTFIFKPNLFHNIFGFKIKYLVQLIIITKSHHSLNYLHLITQLRFYCLAHFLKLLHVWYGAYRYLKNLSCCYLIIHLQYVAMLYRNSQ